ncbi:MAG: thermonuclease family protein [Planctomycetaceae bacterium]
MLTLAVRLQLLTSVLLFAGCAEPQPISSSEDTAAARDEANVTEDAEEKTKHPKQTDASPSDDKPEETPNEFMGKVIRVFDGDMIDILKDDMTTVRILLHGIDAPEIEQPFGNEAREYLSRVIGGKVVRVVQKDRDSSGGMIGDVYIEATAVYSNPANVILPDVFLNRALVQNGLAWHQKQNNADERLAFDEVKARKEELGLWSDPTPIPPWDWRKLSQEEREERQ